MGSGDKKRIDSSASHKVSADSVLLLEALTTIRLFLSEELKVIANVNAVNAIASNAAKISQMNPIPILRLASSDPQSSGPSTYNMDDQENQF